MIHIFIELLRFSPSSFIPSLSLPLIPTFVPATLLTHLTTFTSSHTTNPLYVYPYTHCTSSTSTLLVGFFSMCSYEAFGDVISLAEIEHCVVKSGAYGLNYILCH